MAGDATYQTPVYVRQSGAELHVSSNGRLVVDAGGSVLVQGSVWCDLSRARIISSTAGEQFSSANLGYLSTGSTPSYGCVSTADRTQRIAWSSGSIIGIQFPSVPLPDDFSTANGITITPILGKSASSGSGVTCDIQFWAGLGEAESGTATNAITSTAPTEYSVAIPSSALVGSALGQWSVAVVPSTHDQDQVYLYGLRIDYTRSS